MNIALWIVTGVLAAMYLMAGLLKAISAKEKLAGSLPWVEDYRSGTVKFIGIAEILGALGLVLPWLTGIAPPLTPLAAVGLVVVQVLAISVHVRRGEQKVLAFNILLLVAALFVAILRFAQL